MFCKGCGKELEEETKFCPSCGVDQTAPIPQAQNPQYPPYPQYPYGYAPTPPIDTGSPWWAVMGFFFPMVGLILFLVWIEHKPKSAKMAGLGALISVILSIVGSVLFYILFYSMLASSYSSSILLF